MSDLLTHWAVFDDCRRVARYAEGVLPAFVQVLEEHHASARYGAIARLKEEMPVMHWLRERREDLAGRADLQRKLAYCLARYTHVACDSVMKELRLKAINGAPAGSDEELVGQEVYAYHDAHVFKHVYCNGSEEPFTPFMFRANETPPGRALERLTRSVFVAGLLALREPTAEIDDADRPIVEGIPRAAIHQVYERGLAPRRYMGGHGVTRPAIYRWLLDVAEAREAGSPPDSLKLDGPDFERLIAIDAEDPLEELDNYWQGVQWLTIDLDGLIRACNEPAPEAMEQYAIERDFYFAEDPVIQLARAVQQGEAISSDQGAAALHPSENRSAYARAVLLGIEYLTRASAYWRGESDTIHAPNYNSAEWQQRKVEASRKAFVEQKEREDGATKEEPA